MIEIACWSVSMTSTISISDLLKSFAALVFTVIVDTVGDMLVDLLCASASIEPVRRDLEPMNGVVLAILLLFVASNRGCSAGLLHFCYVRLPPDNRLRVPCSSIIFSSFMLLFRIASCLVQAVIVESRSSEISAVLCWTTGVHHFGSESNLRPLDCFVSSPLGLWDLSLRRHAIADNLVDELRLGEISCFLLLFFVFMWGQLHHCDGLFQNRQWRTHIDDLFVDSLLRELRLRITVFDGVVNVANRITLLPVL